MLRAATSWSHAFGNSTIKMKLTLCWAVFLLTVGPCMACTSGDLRLTGSSSGVLQICKNNEWRIVCSDDWGHVDAAVACKQLGYDGGYEQSTYGSNAGGMTVDPVEYHCNGRESNLQACDKQTTTLCFAYDVVTIVCVRRNASDPCNSGDIRLRGGQTEYEGNIELCNDRGVWNAVCDYSWSTNDAIVACRQLNYTNAIPVTYSNSAFGQRLQPMEYGGLICRGTESSLQQCAVSQTFARTWSNYCDQRDYVGVRCILRPRVACTSGGDLRLTGNSSGVLQICKNNEWRIVCSEDWGHVDAAVACKQLGYDGGYTQSTYSSNTERMTVDPVEYHCNGRESNLQACDNQTTTLCSDRDVVTIVCVQRNASDPCSSGDIRLTDGQTEYEGNIELCNDRGVWSAVCDNSWGTTDAIVACRQLNYTNAISLTYSNSAFGQRLQPMEYGGLTCRGTESSLQQCAVSSFFTRTYSRPTYCNQRNYAGVRCIPRTSAICRNGAVRLTSGYSANNGFAEICLDGLWVGICLQSSPDISTHICKQLGYPRYIRIDQSFFTANRREPLVYMSSFRDYRCRSESSVLLDCVYNSTTYGISYRSTCTPHGILCCPNNTALCYFQQPRADDLTTPPATSTTITPTTPTPTTPPTGGGIDAAIFSLHFGSAATPFILSLAGDLRGLEEDIKLRVVHGVSEECKCPFDISALTDGSFSLGEYVTYSALVHTTAAPNATSIVAMLKTSIEKSPVIYFHGANLHLDVQFEYVTHQPKF